MRPSLLLLALGILVTSSGCVGHGVRRDAVPGLAFVAFELAAHVERLDNPDNPQREWTTTDGSEDDDDESAPAAAGPVPPHMPASAADRRVEHRARFDLGGVYGALAHVELAPCKAMGLTPGYGRVTLAFEHDGAPVGVGVDLPAGSAPAAETCVQRAFGAVRVAPFDGAPVSVRRAFFVAAS